MAKKLREISPKGVKNALTKIGRQRREGLAELSEARRRRRPRRNDLLPDLRLEMRPISSLKLLSRLLRKIDLAQIGRIGGTIAELGFCAPILIDQDGRIIDGVSRVAAAIEEGLVEVPCIAVSHLNETELRVLRLALNRLGETGSWDIDELKLEFAELIELDAPIEATGFSGAEVDMLVFGDQAPAHEVGRLDPDPDLPTICRPGNVWALGDHRIACGDALRPESYRALFPFAGQARLVFTDPPYNVRVRGHVTSGRHREFAMASGEMSRTEFAVFNETWISHTLARLCDGGLAMIFIDWRSLVDLTIAARSSGLEQLNLVVWEKSNGGQGALWRSQHELLPVFKKGAAPHVNNVKLGRHGRYRTNIWVCPGASSLGSDSRRGLRLHPTVKPVALLADALSDVTNRGDIVVDPFLGSGSTLIAAEETGRICRGIEIDPLYVDVAIRRWMEVTGGEPRLVGGIGDHPSEGDEAEVGFVSLDGPLPITDAHAREV